MGRLDECKLYTFIVYIRSDLRLCGLCIWLYIYPVSLIILLPGKKTLCKDLCSFWSMHMFGLPFSQLAVGGLCGNVDIFDACVRKQRYNGTFEFTYTTKSQVRCSVASFSSFFVFVFEAIKTSLLHCQKHRKPLGCITLFSNSVLQLGSYFKHITDAKLLF
jgi:hypothetical protein